MSELRFHAAAVRRAAPLFWTFGLLAFTACGDDASGADSSMPDTGTTDSAMPDGGAEDSAVADGGTDAGSGAPVVGYIFDASDRSRIADAVVCVYEHPEVACDTTDAEGAFVLITDIVGPIALDVQHEDYNPSLVLLETTEAGGSFNGAAIATHAAAAGVAALSTGGDPADPTKGAFASGVLLVDDGQPATGATVTVEPASGASPTYWNGGVPDPTFDAVGDAMQISGVNMDPGEVTLTFAYPDGECQRAEGVSWPAADPSRLDQTRVLIAPGYLTIFAITYCR